MKYLESINNSLHQMMRDDPKVFILGEDILDPYGGAFKVTRGLSSSFPNRVFTTPISEATITGISIGLSLRGFKPILEIMFGDFITLCFDQIINHAAKYYAMYNGKIELPVIIRTPMGGGRGYGPTHSQSLEKYLLGLPYFRIVSPSIFHDPGRILNHCFFEKLPVLFVEHKLLYPLNLINSHDNLVINKIDGFSNFDCIRIDNFSGKQPDVVIITYGGISELIIRVLEKLVDEEIWVTVYLPSSLSPLGLNINKILADSFTECKKLLIIEDASCEFGWSSEVAFQFINYGLKIKRVGASNTIIPASKELERQVLVSFEKIYTNIMEFII